MENKLKQLTSSIMKTLFNTEKHNIESMEQEIVSILAMKMKKDLENVSLMTDDLKTKLSTWDGKDAVCMYLSHFIKYYSFTITENDYKKILKEMNDIDTSKIDRISLTYLKELVKDLLNNEINSQMAMVMNAVKGLRQDLYQNDYCTGAEAYRETVRILFLKMIEDKEIKGGMSKEYNDFNIKTFKDNYNFHIKQSGCENDTETDYMNIRFKEDVLNLNNTAKYPIYAQLFRPTEEIVSNRQMIYKFIQKVENVNIVDLMDYGKDVLGVVYEQFIGEVQNSGAGQIFTPTDVVEFMSDIAELTKDDICLDFCSGSGRFMTSAMRRMINDAKFKLENGGELEEKIENIKHNQVFGADVGADPTLNTKRNMALAGDGSSHIANMNSLLIKSEKNDKNEIVSIFTNGLGVNKKELVGEDGTQFAITNCSCILTNPPFGDLTLDDKYDDAWINEMRETFNTACKSELKRWNSRFDELVKLIGKVDNEEIIDMFDELLDIAPIDRNAQVEKTFEILKIAINEGNKKNINKCVETFFSKGVRTVTTQWKEKKGVKVLDGRKDFKGCLLFLYKAYQILKVGGHVLIVVDDGVLNTDTYAFARDFIRNKFNIKAIFSLSDKAFYAHSDKMIKTSILYLEKKLEILDDDEDIFTVKQTDPVFYAHIEKTGQNSKRGKYESHFNEVKEGYFDFVKKVEENKKTNGGIFNKKSFVFDEVTITAQATNDIEDSEDDYNEE